jgi:hypothetical protein
LVKENNFTGFSNTEGEAPLKLTEVVPFFTWRWTDQNGLIYSKVTVWDPYETRRIVITGQNQAYQQQPWQNSWNNKGKK